MTFHWDGFGMEVLDYTSSDACVLDLLLFIPLCGN